MKSKLILILFGIFLGCLICEVVLRFTWQNPYPQHVLIKYKDIYARFNKPRSEIFYIKGFYKNARYVRFTITSKYYIKPAKGNKNLAHALFLGGSTTECGLIDEGKRWPELVGHSLNLYPLNYGVSGNNLAESLFNLIYLLDKKLVKPKYLFLMHAINDFSLFYFDKPFEIESLANYMYKRRTLINENLFKKLFKSIYLTHFLYITFDNIFLKERSQKIIKWTKSKIEIKRKNFTKVNEKNFKKFIRSQKFKNFLNLRKSIISKIHDICKKNNIRLILITQPDSYRENFKPFVGIDLRELFSLNKEKKIFSIEQSKILMDLINESTKEIAKKEGITLIDAAEKFRNIKDVSDLFWDAVHYTEKGSKLMAKIIVDEINKLGGI